MGNCLQRQTNAQDHVSTHYFANISKAEEGLNSSQPTYEEISEPSTTYVIKPQQPSNERLLVAAIDFGTAFSGYAFSYQHEYNVDPLKISCNLWQHTNGLSNKAPTSVLFGADGQIKSFGYDADLDFADVAHNKDYNQCHFFDRFKMKLFQERAGIPKEQLTLALEPEAASLFCRYLPTFHSATNDSCSSGQYQSMGTGTKYIILDLGGGTADFTVHEVSEDGTLQEIHQASGGYWGGTTVDHKFFSVLKAVFGNETLRQFRQQHPHDMLEFKTDFEIKKRTFTMGQTRGVNLKIPLAFVEVYEETSGGRKVEDAIKQSQYHDKIEIRKDKMIFNPELFFTFFEDSILCILNHIQELLQKPGLSDVSTILLVGGYSESPVVKNRIINKYPQLRVVHPDDSELAILKGAVLFGHKPQAISSRICKYTYGIAMTLPFQEGIDPEEKRYMVGDVSMCDDIYDIHLRIGQKVQIGMQQCEKEYCLFRGQTKGVLDIYASSTPNPRFVSEEGCFHLGRIIIENNEESENNRRIFVKLLYSGTELVVEARNDKGKTIKAYYDFLG